MIFQSFFYTMQGNHPFPYQERLAQQAWPELLSVPTGLGKTAAVVGSWLFKRLIKDPETPIRLIYCLPMRVLVEQTWRESQLWIDAVRPIFEQHGMTSPSVHLLMGGEADDRWMRNPEQHAIIIGTQDMLLSRALLRGYGMSRYQWPIHFALLHNDALWIFDEVQLMGTGLTTACQLEGLRRRLGCARPGRSLWMSATLDKNWLNTVDLRPYLGAFTECSLESDDQLQPVVKKRLAAAKTVHPTAVVLTMDNSKQEGRLYLDTLARAVAEAHRIGTTTLVILNRVSRAQGLWQQLPQYLASEVETLLIHGRFRPFERRDLENKLRQAVPAAGRVVVATQAVEAGVDMTSATLFTELAPCSSLVQRFGRCNRYGEESSADIYWIDITVDKTDELLPYTQEELTQARDYVRLLSSASPGQLSLLHGRSRGGMCVRLRDLMELFHTDPDLSGFDVDIAPFVRDGGVPGVGVYWRAFDGLPANEIAAPRQEELCSVSLGQLRRFLEENGVNKDAEKIQPHAYSAYFWDSLAGNWQPVARLEQLYPGMTLLVRATAGGYDAQRGFWPEGKKGVEVVPLNLKKTQSKEESYGGDPLSYVEGRSGFVTLADHLDKAVAEGEELGRFFKLDEETFSALVAALRWHDAGKGHPVFQRSMTQGASLEGVWAKSPFLGRHERPHFRHELASMLAWLAQEGGVPQGGEDWKNLVAYLIVAHHGKVRMGLRALPEELEPLDGERRRFARGIWEGDELPILSLGAGVMTQAVSLSLALMEIGTGIYGPSWSTRTQRLLERLGPFRLAWLESLVRIADWRASADVDRFGELSDGA
ncbi:MAG: CRISPR-associated helicase Cas3' [Magnetococcus sp. DMHC-6]